MEYKVTFESIIKAFNEEHIKYQLGYTELIAHNMEYEYVKISVFPLVSPHLTSIWKCRLDEGRTLEQAYRWVINSIGHRELNGIAWCGYDWHNGDPIKNKEFYKNNYNWEDGIQPRLWIDYSIDAYKKADMKCATRNMNKENIDKVLEEIRLELYAQLEPI